MNNLSVLPALPEIFLLVMTCVILVVDLFVSDTRRAITHFSTVLTLVATGFLAVYVWPEHPAAAFGDGMFVLDNMAVVLKLVALAAMALVLVYSRDYLFDRNLLQGEFYLLALFSTLGVLVIISAAHLLVLYMGLELMSLSLYALVAFNRDEQKSTEAAMKYFIQGAIASGVLLYGMSLIYGLTGSLEISKIAAHFGQAEASAATLLSMVFIVAALAFKLGAVPFHSWVPDVYEGANAPVALLVGSVPKVAGLALFIRLLVGAYPVHQVDWQSILICLSVLSLGFGAVVAIAQTNIRRLLAYSTINHVGFLLLGFIAGTSRGYGAAMFYTIVYVFMALAAFGVIILLSRKGYNLDNLDDLKGLNERSPWFALILLITLFSLAGVPPTVGFYAKLLVLQAIVQEGMAGLAIFAVVTAIVSTFYYLRILKYVYFDSSEDRTPVVASTSFRVTLSLNGLSLLWFGLMPGALIALCLGIFGV